ncbi:hypothetical protein GCM10025864_11330 [Luteimicrobium album]|uniref:Secreted protein n=1 Tax=Luteimicrobium album TaxID=1054550 RepID=A0ABQ6I0R1_9MICO|nr:hypothetical protein GCM10025864_11330 [Luteimicrobium album]
MVLAPCFAPAAGVTCPTTATPAGVPTERSTVSEKGRSVDARTVCVLVGSASTLRATWTVKRVASGASPARSTFALPAVPRSSAFGRLPSAVWPGPATTVTPAKVTAREPSGLWTAARSNV